MDHRIGIHDFVYRSNRPIVKNAKKVHFQLNQFNGFTGDTMWLNNVPLGHN